MTDKKRCEPPEHLRDKDRIVCWLRRSDDERMLAIWHTGPVPFWNIFDSDSECLPDGWLAFEGWRYLAPVTLPQTVLALVEALKHADLQLEYIDQRGPSGTTPAVRAQIGAALALYREAGR